MALIINGQVGWYSGAVKATDPDAAAFISAVSITNPTQISAIDQLVIGLKNANLWTKFKAIYPFVGGTAAKHRYNLKIPTTNFSDFYMTFYGFGTHSNNGWQADGTNSAADTSIIPSVHMNTNQNNMCFSAYVRNRPKGVLVGTDNNYRTALMPNNNGTSGGVMYYPLNTTNSMSRTPAPTNSGFYMNTRSDNTTVKLFRNGLLYDSTTNVTNGLDNLPILLGARNGYPASLYSDNEFAFASIGSGLTDAESLSFYNVVQAYQTTLGRQV